MNVKSSETLLENYMNRPKWKGKIFMEDEKTCYNEGLDDGLSLSYLEITQLKTQIEKMKNCANCKHSTKGERDVYGECYCCDVDMCKCKISGDLIDWNYKCDKWELRCMTKNTKSL